MPVPCAGETVVYWASNPGHSTINVVHKDNSDEDRSRRRGGRREEEERGDNVLDKGKGLGKQK